MSAQEVSVVASTILALWLVVERRRVLAASCIGVFVISNVTFVLAGLLALPFMRAEATDWFSSFTLNLIQDENIKLAIVLGLGGVLLVYTSYQFSAIVGGRGTLRKRGVNLLSPAMLLRSGFRYKRFAVLSAVAFGLAAGYFVLNVSVFMHGIRAGVLQSRPDLIIDARRASTASYLYVIAVYNVLPYLAVGLWLNASLRPRLSRRLIAWTAVIITSLLLLLVFQKRPLLVFWGALFTSHYWIRASRGEMLRNRLKRLVARLRRRLMLISFGVSSFGVLVALYFTSTRIGRGGEGAMETLSILAQVALQRIVGRLSIPSAMYTHFFPEVVPHYGVANIGAFAKLAGTPLYADTREVFRYFAGDAGSVAVSAIFDFYGAYGIGGWVIGSIVLGVLLSQLDTWLVRLPQTAANVHLKIFALISVFYLSQASLPRTMMGYGALWFYALWLLVASRGRRVNLTADHLGIFAERSGHPLV